MEPSVSQESSEAISSIRLKFIELKDKQSSLTQMIRKVMKNLKSFYNFKIKEYNDILLQISIKEQNMEKLNDELSELNISQACFFTSIDKTYFSNFYNLLSDPSLSKAAIEKLYAFTKIRHKPFFLLKKIIKDGIELKFLIQNSMKAYSATKVDPNEPIIPDIFKEDKMNLLVRASPYPLNQILKAISEFFQVLSIKEKIEKYSKNIREVDYQTKNNAFVILKRKEIEITNNEKIYSDYKKWIEDIDQTYCNYSSEGSSINAEVISDKLKIMEDHLNSWEDIIKEMESKLISEDIKAFIRLEKEISEKHSKQIKFHKVCTKVKSSCDDSLVKDEAMLLEKKKKTRKIERRSNSSLPREYSITNRTETNILDALKETGRAASPNAFDTIANIDEALSDLEKASLVGIKTINKLKRDSDFRAKKADQESSKKGIVIHDSVSMNNNPFRSSCRANNKEKLETLSGYKESIPIEKCPVLVCKQSKII